MKRKRWRWRPPAAGLAFWKGQRAALWLRCGSRCECGCGYRFKSMAEMDAAHVRPLRNTTRYDEMNPLNQLSNLLALRRRCHQRQETERDIADQAVRRARRLQLDEAAARVRGETTC